MKLSGFMSLVSAMSLVSIFSFANSASDAYAAFSQNMQKSGKECVAEVNNICDGRGGVGLMDADRLYEPKNSCIIMKNDSGDTDFVVFYAKNASVMRNETGYPGLVTIIPLDDSKQRCSQIQLNTSGQIYGVAQFGTNVAVAAGGALFEFHKKSLGSASAIFVNEILSQKLNPYKIVTGVEELPQEGKVLVTTKTKNNFILDEDTVSSGTKRSRKIGTISSKSADIKELLLDTKD